MHTAWVQCHVIGIKTTLGGKRSKVIRAALQTDREPERLRRTVHDVRISHHSAPVHQSLGLQQPTLSQDSTTPWGSILGASALITGSTVGAGMLALPAATANAGFGASMTLLGTCWGVLLFEALLLAEINLAVRSIQQQQGSAEMSSDTIVTLRQMAQTTLGPAGAALVTCCYVSLAYGLLVAYISKSGEMISHLSTGMLPESLGMLTSTAAVALLLGLGGAAAADNVNRGLTAGLLVLFSFALVTSAPDGALGPLLAPSDWSLAPSSIPIIFLTLVYHDLVPVLCMMLNNNRGHIRLALLLGSVLPLAMFALWDGVALSVAFGPKAQLLVDQGVTLSADPLQALLQVTSGPTGTALQAFSLLAVVTSFIGVSLGITETAKTEVPLLFPGQTAARQAAPPSAQQTTWKAKLPQQLAAAQPHTSLNAHEGPAAPTVASSTAPAGLHLLRIYLFTLAPAAAIAMTHPASFYGILQAVGAYGMTLLYGILPPIMAGSLLRMQAQEPVNPTATASSTTVMNRNNIIPWARLRAQRQQKSAAGAVASVLLSLRVALRRSSLRIRKGAASDGEARGVLSGDASHDVAAQGLGTVPVVVLTPLLAALLSFSIAVAATQLMHDVGPL